MRVTVVGCAGSYAGPDSPASCYLVQTEHAGRTWRLLLDLGSGALGPLLRHTDPRHVDAIVLSHLHADHCLDLTGLHVMLTHHPQGRSEHRVPVHGPAGTAERIGRAVGVEAAEDVTGAFAFHDLADRARFEVGPFAVEPFAVRHPVPAFGFRVGADGATLAYTGDTDGCPALLPLMNGADLVLADAASVEGRDTDPGVHLSGRRAAQAAVDAGGVRRLVLTHLPAWNDPAVVLAQAREVWTREPGVELAGAGRSYEVG